MYAAGETHTSSAHASTYIGRFAPSPTGPLHFGSLIAAVASYLDAKSHQGRWLLRIDDIDTPRVVPGATDAIIAALDVYGFSWDGPVVYQSQCLGLYQEALNQLKRLDRVYSCSCSRRDLVAWGGIYPGFCRQGAKRTGRAYSQRVRTDNNLLGFQDAIQGHFCQRLESEVGDFVIRRADGIYAYQLAVVVDDAEQGVTHIVRGGDLLDSTPRQLYLQTLLGWSQPDYLHLPVAINRQGHKLSKQTGAPALPTKDPGAPLVAALAFLGQSPPAGLANDRLDAIWQWAIANWRRSAIPTVCATSSAAQLVSMQ